ncbi:hypothetical protein ACFQ0Q_39825 [Streptomyces aureus]
MTLHATTWEAAVLAAVQKTPPLLFSLPAGASRDRVRVCTSPVSPRIRRGSGPCPWRISGACAATGSQGNLTRAFRRWHRQTPSRWRREELAKQLPSPGCE